MNELLIPWLKGDPWSADVPLAWCNIWAHYGGSNKEVYNTCLMHRWHHFFLNEVCPLVRITIMHLTCGEGINLYHSVILIFSVGNSVGGLWAYGPQVLHGNGPNPPGGLGPVCHSQWLVQVVPYLLTGRSQHRTPHQTPLPVLPGERHQPFLHLDTQ